MANLNITPNPQIISVANAGEALNKDLRFLDFSAAGLNPEQAAWVEAEKQAAIASGAAVIIDNSWLTALEEKGEVVSRDPFEADPERVYQFVAQENLGQRIASGTQVQVKTFRLAKDKMGQQILNSQGSPRCTLKVLFPDSKEEQFIYLSLKQAAVLFGRDLQPVEEVVNGKADWYVRDFDNYTFQLAAEGKTNAGLYRQTAGRATWPLAQADNALLETGGTLQAKAQFEAKFAQMSEAEKAKYPEGYKSAHVLVNQDGYYLEPGARLAGLDPGEVSIFVAKKQMANKMMLAEAEMQMIVDQCMMQFRMGMLASEEEAKAEARKLINEKIKASF